MTVFLGADHGGFELKEKIKAWLIQKKYQVKDCGAFQFDAEDDYPDFIFPVAEGVGKNAESRGVVFCRSGAGAVIAANKVKGVRAANVMDVEMIKHGREDNNLNVIGIGADVLDEEKTKKLVEAFLTLPYSGAERHARRIQKITNYENKT